MRVRINNNAPNATQRKALRAECVREFNRLLEFYNKQVAIQILHILRFDYGFGQKRLEAFAKKLSDMQIKTMERYEITEDDVPGICEIQLKDSGINLKTLLEGEK